MLPVQIGFRWWCFFSLSLIVIVTTSIAAQHFGKTHNMVLTVFHEPQGRLHAPILGCSRHLRALRFLDGKLAKVFFQLFCPEIVQAWESHREYIAVHLYGHFTPDFYPSEALYLTFNGWEKAVTFRWFGIMLERWFLFQITKKISYGKAQFVTNGMVSWQNLKLPVKR